MMELVLRYTHRQRMIISIPFVVGTVQGAVMERLPLNLLTITRAQVWPALISSSGNELMSNHTIQVQQLKKDNIVSQPIPEGHVSFKNILEKHSDSLPQSVHDILPAYL
jgi:NADH dehydrogenase